MFSSPRPVLFFTELSSPPIKELAFPKGMARVLYTRMHEPDGHAYENLEMQTNPPTLSTRHGDEGRSTCQIGKNLIRLEELNPEMSSDAFAGIVETVLRGLRDEFRPFFIQKVKINCLSQPLEDRNPLAILAVKIANIGDKIGPFGRPPKFFGVRFRFEPWEPQDELGEEDDEIDDAIAESAQSGEPNEGEALGKDSAIDETDELDNIPQLIGGRGFVTVRFEPYNEDPSQLWIEVAANYLADEPITLENLSIVRKNILETCQFATDNCKRFLDQFDPTTPNS